MLSTIGRLVLFASSYAPLLALFAILESFGGGWATWVCGAAAASSVIALIVVWSVLYSQSSTDQGRFEGARSRDADVMAYFVSYVVPFAAADNSDSRTRTALVLFAIIIAILYVRSTVFYVHPLLLLVGYHVYEAVRDGVPVIVITRQPHLRQNCSMRVVHVSINVYLERPA